MDIKHEDPLKRANPLVSIITPVFNAEKFISQTVQSVLEQSYQNWELLLIVDQKNSDQSQTICQNWAQKDQRIKVVSSPKCVGVANNRNYGLQIAQGAYIAFLDSDDIWLPQKLSTQITFMTKNKVSITCHSFQPIDEFNQNKGPIRQVPQVITLEQLLKNNCIGCLTVVLSSDLAQKHQFSAHVLHEDYLYWLSILKSGIPIWGLPECLAQYRVVSGSRSNNKLKAALGRWQIYRQELNLSLVKSLYYMTWYIFSAVAKR